MRPTQAFVLHNDGPGRLTNLTGVMSNLNFEIVSPGPTSIEEGQSGTWLVRPVIGLGPSPTAYTGNLIITGAHDFRVTTYMLDELNNVLPGLRFTVNPAVASVSPGMYEWATLVAGYTEQAAYERSFRVDNRGRYNMFGVEAYIPPAYANYFVITRFTYVDALGVTQNRIVTPSSLAIIPLIPSGGAGTFYVRPRLGLSPDRYEGQLVIRGNDLVLGPDDEEGVNATIQITLRLRVVPPTAEAVPERADFVASAGYVPQTLPLLSGERYVALRRSNDFYNITGITAAFASTGHRQGTNFTVVGNIPEILVQQLPNTPVAELPRIRIEPLPGRPPGLYYDVLVLTGNDGFRLEIPVTLAVSPIEARVNSVTFAPRVYGYPESIIIRPALTGDERFPRRITLYNDEVAEPGDDKALIDLVVSLPPGGAYWFTNAAGLPLPNRYSITFPRVHAQGTTAPSIDYPYFYELDNFVSFYVRPRVGLGVGTHSGHVTLSAPLNEFFMAAGLSFTVYEPVFSARLYRDFNPVTSLGTSITYTPHGDMGLLMWEARHLYSEAAIPPANLTFVNTGTGGLTGLTAYFRYRTGYFQIINPLSHTTLPVDFTLDPLPTNLNNLLPALRRHATLGVRPRLGLSDGVFVDVLVIHDVDFNVLLEVELRFAVSALDVTLSPSGDIHFGTWEEGYTVGRYVEGATPGALGVDILSHVRTLINNEGFWIRDVSAVWRSGSNVANSGIQSPFLHDLLPVPPETTVSINWPGPSPRRHMLDFHIWPQEGLPAGVYYDVLIITGRSDTPGLGSFTHEIPVRMVVVHPPIDARLHMEHARGPYAGQTAWYPQSLAAGWDIPYQWDFTSPIPVGQALRFDGFLDSTHPHYLEMREVGMRTPSDYYELLAIIQNHSTQPFRVTGVFLEGGSASYFRILDTPHGGLCHGGFISNQPLYSHPTSVSLQIRPRAGLARGVYTDYLIIVGYPNFPARRVPLRFEVLGPEPVYRVELTESNMTMIPPLVPGDPYVREHTPGPVNMYIGQNPADFRRIFLIENTGTVDIPFYAIVASIPPAFEIYRAERRPAPTPAGAPFPAEFPSEVIHWHEDTFTIVPDSHGWWEITVQPRASFANTLANPVLPDSHPGYFVLDAPSGGGIRVTTEALLTLNVSPRAFSLELEGSHIFDMYVGEDPLCQYADPDITRRRVIFTNESSIPINLQDVFITFDREWMQFYRWEGFAVNDRHPNFDILPGASVAAIVHPRALDMLGLVYGSPANMTVEVRVQPPTLPALPPLQRPVAYRYTLGLELRVNGPGFTVVFTPADTVPLPYAPTTLPAFAYIGEPAERHRQRVTITNTSRVPMPFGTLLWVGFSAGALHGDTSQYFRIVPELGVATDIDTSGYALPSGSIPPGEGRYFYVEPTRLAMTLAHTGTSPGALSGIYDAVLDIRHRFGVSSVSTDPAYITPLPGETVTLDHALHLVVNPVVFTLVEYTPDPYTFEVDWRQQPFNQYITLFNESYREPIPLNQLIIGGTPFGEGTISGNSRIFNISSPAGVVLFHAELLDVVGETHIPTHSSIRIALRPTPEAVIRAVEEIHRADMEIIYKFAEPSRELLRSHATTAALELTINAPVIRVEVDYGDLDFTLYVGQQPDSRYRNTFDPTGPEDMTQIRYITIFNDSFGPIYRNQVNLNLSQALITLYDVTTGGAVWFDYAWPVSAGAVLPVPAREMYADGTPATPGSLRIPIIITQRPTPADVTSPAAITYYTNAGVPHTATLTVHVRTAEGGVVVTQAAIDATDAVTPLRLTVRPMHIGVDEADTRRVNIEWGEVPLDDPDEHRRDITLYNPSEWHPMYLGNVAFEFTTPGVFRVERATPAALTQPFGVAPNPVRPWYSENLMPPGDLTLAAASRSSFVLMPDHPHATHLPPGLHQTELIVRYYIGRDSGGLFNNPGTDPGESEFHYVRFLLELYISPAALRVSAASLYPPMDMYVGENPARDLPDGITCDGFRRRVITLENLGRGVIVPYYHLSASHTALALTGETWFAHAWGHYTADGTWVPCTPENRVAITPGGFAKLAIYVSRDPITMAENISHGGIRTEIISFAQRDGLEMAIYPMYVEVNLDINTVDFDIEITYVTYPPDIDLTHIGMYRDEPPAEHRRRVTITNRATREEIIIGAGHMLVEFTSGQPFIIYDRGLLGGIQPGTVLLHTSHSSLSPNTPSAFSFYIQPTAQAAVHVTTPVAIIYDALHITYGRTTGASISTITPNQVIPYTNESTFYLTVRRPRFAVSTEALYFVLYAGEDPAITSARMEELLILNEGRGPINLNNLQVSYASLPMPPLTFDDGRFDFVQYVGGWLGWERASEGAIAELSPPPWIPASPRGLATTDIRLVSPAAVAHVQPATTVGSLHVTHDDNLVRTIPVSLEIRPMEFALPTPASVDIDLGTAGWGESAGDFTTEAAITNSSEWHFMRLENLTYSFINYVYTPGATTSGALDAPLFVVEHIGYLGGNPTNFWPRPGAFSGAGILAHDGTLPFTIMPSPETMRLLPGTYTATLRIEYFVGGDLSHYVEITVSITIEPPSFSFVDGDGNLFAFERFSLYLGEDPLRDLPNDRPHYLRQFLYVRNNSTGVIQPDDFDVRTCACSWFRFEWVDDDGYRIADDARDYIHPGEKARIAVYVDMRNAMPQNRPDRLVEADFFRLPEEPFPNRNALRPGFVFIYVPLAGIMTQGSIGGTSAAFELDIRPVNFRVEVNVPVGVAATLPATEFNIIMDRYENPNYHRRSVTIYNQSSREDIRIDRHMLERMGVYFTTGSAFEIVLGEYVGSDWVATHVGNDALYGITIPPSPASLTFYVRPTVPASSIVSTSSGLLHIRHIHGDERDNLPAGRPLPPAAIAVAGERGFVTSASLFNLTVRAPQFDIVSPAAMDALHIIVYAGENPALPSIDPRRMAWLEIENRSAGNMNLLDFDQGAPSGFRFTPAALGFEPFNFIQHGGNAGWGPPPLPAEPWIAGVPRNGTQGGRAHTFIRLEEIATPGAIAITGTGTTVGSLTLQHIDGAYNTRPVHLTVRPMNVGVVTSAAVSPPAIGNGYNVHEVTLAWGQVPEDDHRRTVTLYNPSEWNPMRLENLRYSTSAALSGGAVVSFPYPLFIIEPQDAHPDNRWPVGGTVSGSGILAHDATLDFTFVPHPQAVLLPPGTYTTTVRVRYFIASTPAGVVFYGVGEYRYVDFELTLHIENATISIDDAQRQLRNYNIYIDETPVVGNTHLLSPLPGAEGFGHHWQYFDLTNDGPGVLIPRRDFTIDFAGDGGNWFGYEWRFWQDGVGGADGAWVTEGAITTGIPGSITYGQTARLIVFVNEIPTMGSLTAPVGTPTVRAEHFHIRSTGMGLVDADFRFELNLEIRTVDLSMVVDVPPTVTLPAEARRIYMDRDEPTHDHRRRVRVYNHSTRMETMIGTGTTHMALAFAEISVAASPFEMVYIDTLGVEHVGMDAIALLQRSIATSTSAINNPFTFYIRPTTLAAATVTSPGALHHVDHLRMTYWRSASARRAVDHYDDDREITLVVSRPVFSVTPYLHISLYEGEMPDDPGRPVQLTLTNHSAGPLNLNDLELTYVAIGGYTFTFVTIGAFAPTVGSAVDRPDLPGGNWIGPDGSATIMVRKEYMATPGAIADPRSRPVADLVISHTNNHSENTEIHLEVLRHELRISTTQPAMPALPATAQWPSGVPLTATERASTAIPAQGTPPAGTPNDREAITLRVEMDWNANQALPEHSRTVSLYNHSTRMITSFSSLYVDGFGSNLFEFENLPNWLTLAGAAADTIPASPTSPLTLNHRQFTLRPRDEATRLNPGLHRETLVIEHLVAGNPAYGSHYVTVYLELYIRAPQLEITPPRDTTLYFHTYVDEVIQPASTALYPHHMQYIEIVNHSLGPVPVTHVAIELTRLAGHSWFNFTWEGTVEIGGVPHIPARQGADNGASTLVVNINRRIPPVTPLTDAALISDVGTHVATFTLANAVSAPSSVPALSPPHAFNFSLEVQTVNFTMVESLVVPVAAPADENTIVMDRHEVIGDQHRRRIRVYNHSTRENIVIGTGPGEMNLYFLLTAGQTGVNLPFEIEDLENIMLRPEAQRTIWASSSSLGNNFFDFYIRPTLARSQYVTTPPAAATGNNVDTLRITYWRASGASLTSPYTPQRDETLFTIHVNPPRFTVVAPTSLDFELYEGEDPHREDPHLQTNRRRLYIDNDSAGPINTAAITIPNVTNHGVTFRMVTEDGYNGWHITAPITPGWIPPGGTAHIYVEKTVPAIPANLEPFGVAAPAYVTVAALRLTHADGHVQDEYIRLRVVQREMRLTTSTQTTRTEEITLHVVMDWNEDPANHHHTVNLYNLSTRMPTTLGALRFTVGTPAAVTLFGHADGLFEFVTPLPGDIPASPNAHAPTPVVNSQSFTIRPQCTALLGPGLHTETLTIRHYVLGHFSHFVTLNLELYITAPDLTFGSFNGAGYFNTYVDEPFNAAGTAIGGSALYHTQRIPVENHSLGPMLVDRIALSMTRDAGHPWFTNPRWVNALGQPVTQIPPRAGGVGSAPGRVYIEVDINHNPSFAAPPLATTMPGIGAVGTHTATLTMASSPAGLIPVLATAPTRALELEVRPVNFSVAVTRAAVTQDVDATNITMGKDERPVDHHRQVVITNESTRRPIIVGDGNEFEQMNISFPPGSVLELDDLMALPLAQRTLHPSGSSLGNTFTFYVQPTLAASQTVMTASATALHVTYGRSSDTFSQPPASHPSANTHTTPFTLTVEPPNFTIALPPHMYFELYEGENPENRPLRLTIRNDGRGPINLDTLGLTFPTLATFYYEFVTMPPPALPSANFNNWVNLAPYYNDASWVAGNGGVAYVYVRLASMVTLPAITATCVPPYNVPMRPVATLTLTYADHLPVTIPVSLETNRRMLNVSHMYEQPERPQWPIVIDPVTQEPVMLPPIAPQSPTEEITLRVVMDWNANQNLPEFLRTVNIYNLSTRMPSPLLFDGLDGLSVSALQMFDFIPTPLPLPPPSVSSWVPGALGNIPHSPASASPGAVSFTLRVTEEGTMPVLADLGLRTETLTITQYIEGHPSHSVIIHLELYIFAPRVVVRYDLLEMRPYPNDNRVLRYNTYVYEPMNATVHPPRRVQVDNETEGPVYVLPFGFVGDVDGTGVTLTLAALAPSEATTFNMDYNFGEAADWFNVRWVNAAGNPLPDLRIPAGGHAFIEVDVLRPLPATVGSIGWHNAILLIENTYEVGWSARIPLEFEVRPVDFGMRLTTPVAINIPGTPPTTLPPTPWSWDLHMSWGEDTTHMNRQRVEVWNYSTRIPIHISDILGAAPTTPAGLFVPVWPGTNTLIVPGAHPAARDVLPTAAYWSSRGAIRAFYLIPDPGPPEDATRPPRIASSFSPNFRETVLTLQRQHSIPNSDERINLRLTIHPNELEIAAAHTNFDPIYWREPRPAYPGPLFFSTTIANNIGGNEIDLEHITLDLMTHREDGIHMFEIYRVMYFASTGSIGVELELIPVPGIGYRVSGGSILKAGAVVGGDPMNPRSGGHIAVTLRATTPAALEVGTHLESLVIGLPRSSAYTGPGDPRAYFSSVVTMQVLPPRYTLDPIPVPPINIQQGGAGSQQVRVINTGRGPLYVDDLIIEWPSAVFDVSWPPGGVVLPGEYLILTIIPIPGLSLGTHTGTLTVRHIYDSPIQTAVITIVVSPPPPPPPPPPPDDPGVAPPGVGGPGGFIGIRPLPPLPAAASTGRPRRGSPRCGRARRVHRDTAPPAVAGGDTY